MGGRSQRHLREIQGVDSAGETEADYGWVAPVAVTTQAEPEKPKKKKKKSKLFGGSDEPEDTPPADE